MKMARKPGWITGLMLAVFAVGAQATDRTNNGHYNDRHGTYGSNVTHGYYGNYGSGYGTGYDSGYDNSRYYDDRYYNDRYSGARRSVNCESRSGYTVFCRIYSNDVVRLVDQYSVSACIPGRTWGVANGTIWVTRGCRARFLVGYAPYDSYGRGYGYNYGNRGYGNEH